ncbi:tagaturonate reductase [Runella sp.]|uniref:tagaturonate reductase n=1 Tax=Runella sp. TaxID=1960881 RepID=UPI002633A470|nr:tagaturonate reductase [Runella sp.]
MNYLSKNELTHLRNTPNLVVTDDGLFELPEKVLQFGTGVLLRGLPDYLIDKANRQGIFNGRIVVVKSTDSGDSTAFDEQDGLYTLCVRGVELGQNIEENIICSAISRVLSAKSQWQGVLDCAKNPELQIIISNTTEVGIQLVQDNISETPPTSFPGKLLAFLYARFKAFGGTKESGFVIVPTELISDNGSKLESIVIELAHRNGLESDFLDWLESANHFCNSLVDRIVPGKPDNNVYQAITQELGYKDKLLTISEVFSLWAIEGDAHVKQILSFAQADEGVFIEPDINLFRELKLRLLNGTHTLSCGLAYLAGFDTVIGSMQNEDMAAYISNLMLAELGLAIPYPMDEKRPQRFGMQVIDRFRNPHLNHQWLSITLNYSSKMKMRNIATLLNYYEIFACVPEYFSLGFAAYLYFMKPVAKESFVYFGERNGKPYPIQDQKAEYFYSKWQQNTPAQLVETVLQDKNLWDTDLTLLPGFAQSVTENLENMLENGVKPTLEAFFLRNTVQTVEVNEML